MEQAAQTLAGHNRPPADADPLQDRLTEDYATLTARRDELIARMPNVPAVIEDEKTCEDVSDFIKQLKLAAKVADGHRSDEKQPHLDANKTIQSFFMDVVDPLKAAAKKLEFRTKAYNEIKLEAERKAARERERIAREEAEELARKAAEAEQGATNDEQIADAIIAGEEAEKALATADNAEKATHDTVNNMSRTRSEAGTTSSLSTFWNFRNLNMAEIDLEALRLYINREPIEKAVKIAIRHGVRNIKGVDIFEDSRSTVR